MKAKKIPQGFLIRLDKGEEIIATLQDFCQKKRIHAAWISGIGSIEEVVLSYYRHDHQTYLDEEIEGMLEIASLTGNVALVDKKPTLHIHCVLADRQMNCFAGHLKEGLIGSTCEIKLEILGGAVSRSFDSEIGLHLLKLD